MHFPNVPLIPVGDYARKIAKKIEEDTPGDYFIEIRRDDIMAGQVSHIDVASVYKRRGLWFPKCLARVANAVPLRGGPGNVDIKFYDGVDLKKLEVIVENMRVMYSE